MSKRRQRAEIRLTAVSGEDLEVGQNVVWERPFRDKSGSEYDAGCLIDEENGEYCIIASFRSYDSLFLAFLAISRCARVYGRTLHYRLHWLFAEFQRASRPRNSTIADRGGVEGRRENR